MSARKQKSEKVTAAAVAAGVSREQIERRAYEIFRRRSGEPGDPTADWLQAERELLEEARHAPARGAAHASVRREGPRRPAPRSGT